MPAPYNAIFIPLPYGRSLDTSDLKGGLLSATSNARIYAQYFKLRHRPVHSWLILLLFRRDGQKKHCKKEGQLGQVDCLAGSTQRHGVS
jgi:hypothetical protein